MFAIDQKQQEIITTVKRNLNDKLQVSNGEIHFTHKYMNSVMHTNFTAMCATEADFCAISSMLKEPVISWNALQCRFSKCVEITQSKSHYPVQDHSRLPILVLIESSYTTSLPPILHRFQVTVKFSLARGECLTLTHLLGVIPANIAVSDISLKT